MTNHTIEYYNRNAAEYFDSVIAADMTKTYRRFLQYVPDGGSIIDLGCGSGRDLKFFREKGYMAEGIDASEKLCELAREYSGCPVVCTDFLSWKADGLYDAFWANASLLHLTENEIISFFEEKTRYLAGSGVVYMSMKTDISRGDDAKGRYFTPFSEELFGQILESSELDLLERWSDTDALGRSDTKWESVILRAKKR
ncbi:MAG: class I SAM-dependent methyltransferase [Spirochaetales bacterium]|nr:class I SAM-dependent methyltransferase [Spirochaetales bacterium]